MRSSVISFLLVFTHSILAIDVCVDLSATCVEKSHLCNLSAYDGLMNVYCKKTCNRDCTPYTTTTTLKPCADLTPDCVNKKALCTMVSFSALTTQYCAKTCNRCI